MQSWRWSAFRKLMVVIGIACFCLGLSYAHAEAGDDDERRIRSGLKLFRSLLAADEDLTTKITADGELLIIVLYVNDRARAQVFAEELQQLGQGSLHDHPVRVELSSDVSLASYRTRPPAGVYLAQPLYDNELKQFVQYSIDQHVIIYSPFKGHVEKGVLAGLAVEARVLPYIHMKTLEASKIRIKPFYLKVAKQYES